MKAKILYNQLLCGLKTYDEIEPKYQPQVKALAKADVEAGKMPVSQYEELFHEPYVE